MYRILGVDQVPDVQIGSQISGIGIHFSQDLHMVDRTARVAVEAEAVSNGEFGEIDLRVGGQAGQQLADPFGGEVKILGLHVQVQRAHVRQAG